MGKWYTIPEENSTLKVATINGKEMPSGDGWSNCLGGNLEYIDLEWTTNNEWTNLARFLNSAICKIESIKNNFVPINSQPEKRVWCGYNGEVYIDGQYDVKDLRGANRELRLCLEVAAKEHNITLVGRAEFVRIVKTLSAYTTIQFIAPKDNAPENELELHKQKVSYFESAIKAGLSNIEYGELSRCPYTNITDANHCYISLEMGVYLDEWGLLDEEVSELLVKSVENAGLKLNVHLDWEIVH